MNEQEMLMNGVAQAIGPMIFMLLLVLFILLFNRIVNGMLCKRLAAKKGYSGYFFTGFFWGLMGLLYVVGLPDLNAKKDVRAVMKRMVNVNDRVTALEENARRV